MKMRWATFSVMAVLLTGGAKQVWGLQQGQHGQPQYNEHDRQATKDWYNQHGDKAPIGLRAQDRKPAYEQQLQPGSVLSAPLRRRAPLLGARGPRARGLEGSGARGSRAQARGPGLEGPGSGLGPTEQASARAREFELSWTATPLLRGLTVHDNLILVVAGPVGQVGQSRSLCGRLDRRGGDSRCIWATRAWSWRYRVPLPSSQHGNGTR